MVFEEFKEEEFYQVSTYHSELLIGQKLSVPNAYALISKANQQNGDLYNRSYTKLPVYLANVGGFINALLIITKIFLKFFMDYHLLIDYINVLVNSPNIKYTNRSLDFNKNSEINPVSIIPKNLNVNLRNNVKLKTNENNIKKTKTILTSNFINYLFPKLCFKSNYLILNLCQEYIKKKLSTEEIIKSNHILENLKLILLDQKQINILNELYKVNYRNLESPDYKKLFSETLPQLNEENYIDKNLLKILMSYNNLD